MSFGWGGSGFKVLWGFRVWWWSPSYLLLLLCLLCLIVSQAYPS